MQLRHSPPHSCSGCSNSACDSIQWSRKRCPIILSYLILNSAIDRQDETRILMIILSFMSIKSSFVLFTSCGSILNKISIMSVIIIVPSPFLTTQNSLSLSHHTTPYQFISIYLPAAHFSDVFKATDVSAALAAGMFHRGEVSISEVKKHMVSSGITTRL